MLPGDVAQWGATGAICVGLLYTIFKNGSAQKTRDIKIAVERGKRDTFIDEKLKYIGEAIKSPETGLVALSKDIGVVKTNCAVKTNDYDSRLKTLEKPKRRR